MNIQDIKSLFPELLDKNLREEIISNSSIKEMHEGDHLIDVGSYIKMIPLVTSGKIKVFREDEDGNELFLYYIGAGETCSATLVCSERDRKSQIKAIAVEDSEMICVPIKFMDKWVQEYKDWYYFILGSYRLRFQELLDTLDSVAFHKMDERILDYLNKTKDASGSNEINSTHQEIATELHTSREVVSRLLKQMEKKGMLELGRNKIILS